MKRILGAVAVVVLMAAPVSAHAATLSAGEQYTLPADRAVNGNLYIAAGTASVGGRVTGDVFAAGGTVSLTGSIGGDVAVGGGNIQILGPVDGDVRAVGGSVTVYARVGGDLVVAGGTAHILPGATISGDVVVAGGQIIIDGTVNGSVRAAAGVLILNGTVQGGVSAKIDERLAVGPHARIGGSLVYSARSEADFAEGSVISGPVSYTPRTGPSVGSQSPQRVLWVVANLLTGMRLLMALGLAALLMWRWRRASMDVLVDVQQSFWASLGRGITYAVLVPLATALLLISFVGTLPGVLLLLGYAALWVLTQALAGMFIGAFAVMLAKKRTALNLTWASALGGVIAMKFIVLIPVVGWLISLAVSLATFGALAHRAQSSLLRS